MQTLFRAAVMIVVGVVAVKAWKLYGPTNEQVKSTFTQVVETVQSTIQGWRQPNATTPNDPRASAPPIAQTPPTASLSAPTAQADAPQLLPQSAPAVSPASAPSASSNGPAVAGEKWPNDSVAGGDRAQQLVSRLQQLGAAETKLAPWGSDGNLYRFTCRAPLPNAPSMMQHFESVAADPAAAVEEVLTKVESWQIAQRENANRRY
jgi:hypothetical protein